MSKPDGGPAFPATVANGCNGGVTGMSLRDWFAGQALVALFSQSAHPLSPGIGETAYIEAAWQAYRLADAMLVARHAREATP